MFKKIVPFLIIPLFLTLIISFGVFFPDIMVGILLSILILTTLYSLSYLSFIMFGEKILGEEEYKRLVKKMDIFG